MYLLTVKLRPDLTSFCEFSTSDASKDQKPLIKFKLEFLSYFRLVLILL